MSRICNIFEGMISANPYLLLTELEGRTVSYGRAWVINRRGKTRIRNLQYGPRKRG